MKHRRRNQYIEKGQQADAGLFSRQRAVDDVFLEKTIRLFQERTGETLSKEDARQIVENVTGFFRTLQDWDRAERSGQAAPGSGG